MSVVVRDAVVDDVEAITTIQNALLATTAIEWTDEPHTVEGCRLWLGAQRADARPVLVADHDGQVVGFTTYGDFRDSVRWPGYRLTVEHSIHVREDHWGMGVGRALIEALVERARADGKHVMVAAVDAENEESIHFHERLGFEVTARMPQIGTKFGRWLDLVLLQRVLD